ncbi:alpha-L-arabinofuranosidase C-terminal domain-containing protein [Paenibacillus sp. NPDC056579]|uniref:alpha-L-arabinofuranosidase C-terminal domain-containing protein n=1 Tax=Paenibacillus sp. NPDC056579 TaxID=3345871 RepID=UPI0036BEA669
MIDRAKISVNCGRVGDNPVNPYIFGHFVEDIRDHMEAMLAYSIKDMDFESGEKHDGVSGSWYPYTNGRNTKYRLEPAASKHSGHSQTIRIFSEDGCYAGITQRIAVKGGISYQLKVGARASIELRTLLVEIASCKSGEILGGCQLELSSHNWQEYDATFEVTDSCMDAELRIYVPSTHERWRDSIATGYLWLDHVSLLPCDSVGNVKREVFEMSRELNAGMMRLAGNYISAYHWRHAVGPVLERPNMINEAWGGWTAKTFGTDEFIQFCRDLNVEPLICVNAGSGTPEEAAQWVEYCNGGPETPMGALRAANGYPEPYGVKYWEVGNEIYGPWQVGHCTAEKFAHRYVEFAKAMKAADGSICLMACGDTRSEWNRPMLEIAGEFMDFLTIHIYHGYNRFGMNAATPREERFKAIMSFAERTHEVITRAADLIRSSQRHNHVKLALTEYNTMYYPNTIRKGLPMEHTLEAAAANAANLNTFIRNSDMVQVGSYSDLVNGWLGGCIRVGDFYADQFRGKAPGWSGKPLTVYGTPTYYVMQLYANRDIRFVAHTDVQCGEFSVKAPNARVNMDGLPVLDVVACMNESMDKATVFVVNRSLQAVRTELEINGLETHHTAQLYEITGESIDDINSVFEPELIKIAHTEIQRTGSSWEFEFRASSVYAIEFQKRGH